MPKKTGNSQYKLLAEKWSNRHRNLQSELFSNHKDAFKWLVDNSKQLAVGSLASIFLLSSPVVAKIPGAISTASAQVSQAIDRKVFLVYDLKNVLPNDVRPLTADEEKNVSEILTRDFGISVSAELDGKRLNTTYGLIGQEQHLPRYPGDNIFNHFTSQDESGKYWSYGMTPGLGAWGYFTNSSGTLTQTDIDREKYYIAVQTFLSPGFDNNTKEYTDFFKYRKMLVVNPQNGKAVVSDIADAGPSPWTGKQLGGSPEVMNYLERVDGSQRGPVLYFFIDDPSDTIPLGPVQY
ncbi:MAG TPA: hypothetical protein VMR77_02275 [Patescibacteria group bacterium]|jgi:hypothetical protein|nr:hypothetical protein [Patescibacteria group bacterium]